MVFRRVRSARETAVPLHVQADPDVGPAVV